MKKILPLILVIPFLVFAVGKKKDLKEQKASYATYTKTQEEEENDPIVQKAFEIPNEDDDDEEEDESFRR